MRRALIVLLAALAAMAALPMVSSTATAATYGSTSISRVVSAGGVKQYINCQGTRRGGVTVILIAGLDSSSERAKAGWLGTQPGITGFTRACRYDRPGLGNSPRRAATVTLTPLTHAAELEALLRAVGEPGPFVVVGHSYGGLIARAYALRYPSRVAGVVLLDAAWAGQGASDGYRWPEPETGARRAIIDMAATSDLLGGKPNLRTKPLVVVTAGIGNTADWMRHQNSMAGFSTNSVHLLATNSDHEIQYYVPSLTRRAIREVWAGAVMHRSLPRCLSLRSTWRSLGATCA